MFTPEGPQDLDLAVAGGRILEIAAQLAPGAEEVDARGL